MHEGLGDRYVRRGMGSYEEGCKSLNFVRGLALNQGKQSIMVMINYYG